MVVKHEIKSQLAKLLATEDLIVENKPVETAEFDVHTRVLTLPTWDKASNNVYDMLVGHEVGHALYTPDIDWRLTHSIPKSIVNIVEDARIEKLMKRRYEGLAKTFYNGYNELHDRDFFEVENEDLSDLNLADRINLYFKVGSFLKIPFLTTEKQIIGLINDCETFTETLSAAEALYNFCKQEQEDREKTEQDSGEDFELIGDISNGSSSDNNSSLPDSDSSDSMEGRVDTHSDDISGGNRSNVVDDIDDEIELQTVDALEESLKDLVNTSDRHPNTYVELPKVDLEKIIISNNFVHNNINRSWIEQQKEWDESEHMTLPIDLFQEADINFNKFKRSSQKEVNYLVKEFECKKAADAYARSTTSRTGVLSTEKLHTYKFNEDLFKKISVIPDGKNHGLVFVLDWSGSMQSVLLDTLKQLYNLLWFCKKVNIPFEVYAFTNDHPPVESEFHDFAYEKKEGMVFIESTFSLMNLFTSKVRNKELEVQMRNIFRVAMAVSYEYHTYYNYPLGMGLSGTPLNEAIISLHQILPKFKKENNLQKVQCIILTDGEAAPIRYSKEFNRGWEDNPYMGTAYVHDHCVIRNRKTGYTYSCRGLGHWADVTDLLLKDIRQTFSDINFIGIRVLQSRDAGQFVRRYAGYDGNSYDTIMKRWRKEKSFSIKNSGYHSYFGLLSTALSSDDEFEVEEDATKAQIKKAFVKSLKTKKMNKKMLSEFMELVA